MAADTPRILELRRRVQADPAPVMAPVLAPPTPVKVAELFDFDTLSRQLGETLPASAAEGRYGETLPQLASLDRTSVGGPSPIDAVDLSLHQNDAFADVERDLRERVEQRAADDKAARMLLAAQRQSAIVAELEDWLAAIAVDRRWQTFGSR